MGVHRTLVLSGAVLLICGTAVAVASLHTAASGG